MEQIIIGLVGLILTVIVFLERSRRADTAAIRQEIAAARDEAKADNATLRDELKTEIRAARDDAKTDNAALRRELKEEMAIRSAHTDQHIETLTAAIRDEMAIRSASTDRQIEGLKDAVIKLVETVGQVKGRTEVLTAAN